MSKMNLSEELKHWGYHSSISDEGKKQHLEMAERAEQLELNRAQDFIRFTQLEADVDKWKTESNRLYGVGQDIEADRVALQKRADGLRDGIAYYLKHSHLFSLGKEYDKDAPAKLEALIAGGD
jgi:hypothetical protein